MIYNNFKGCHGTWHPLFSKTSKVTIVFLFVLHILFSCTKEIQIDIHNDNKLLVVNSIFNDDKPFSFRFSNTAPILNNYDTIMDSLHFILYENKHRIIDTLFLSKNLFTNVYPKPNTSYSVEVHSKNYPVLTASDSMGQMVGIDEATLKYPAGVDAYGDEYVEASISFSDPLGEQNYYELLLYTQNGSYAYYWIGYNELQVTDLVLLNEGDVDYKPTSYFFSDELFDGKKYTMRIKQLGPQTKVRATLRSVSKSYYLYRKYYTRHVHNQQIQGNFLDLIFMGEPQTMYTNATNGYGIFAGFTETSTDIINIK